MTPVVAQLFIYPIKSCAGISVTEFQFDQKGPLFDRRWMLVDAQTGVFLSQRKFAKMALIATRIEKGRVWAQQKSDQDLTESICLPVDGELRDVKVWSDEVSGMDCGDEAAAWFSALLKHECRLVYQGECLRKADEEFAQTGTQISYADGFPLLVVAQSSIERLNLECKDAEITAANFRPNVVVDNTLEFAETDWGEIVCDTLKMKVVKPCQRCVIPTINPETGEKEGVIMSVLKQYCRREKKIYFGQNSTFESGDGAKLSVGQELVIN